MDNPLFLESHKHAVFSLSDSETEGIEVVGSSRRNEDDRAKVSPKAENDKNKKVLRKRKRIASKQIVAGRVDWENYQKKRLAFSLTDSEAEEVEQISVQPPKNAKDDVTSKPRTGDKKVLRKKKRAVPKPTDSEIVEGDKYQEPTAFSLTDSESEGIERTIDLALGVNPKNEEIEKVASKPKNESRKVSRKRKIDAPKPPAKKQQTKEKEQCSICLKNISANIGNPSHCKHRFCLLCLKKWAKENASCPLDRTEFCYINVVKKNSGKVEMRIDCQGKVITLATCGICHSNERQNWLVPCDHCDTSFHVGCLPNPAAVSIPLWRCHSCENAEPVPLDSSQQRLNALNRSFALQLLKVHCQITEKAMTLSST